jgi:hypothetical protein
MTPSCQLEVKILKKYILETRKIKLREITMKFGRLVIFIFHNSAEIWGIRYGLILGIGTKKIWPAPVFSCV